jgi:hypothetical protein
MKNFKSYLTENAASHVYVIKFAQEPTQEQIQIIEAWLQRFDLLNSTKITMIENDTKDFIDIPNRQIYAFEVTLGTPVSQYILLQDLKTAANISEKYMVVRSALEPIQQYAEYDSWNRAQNKIMKDKGLVPAARLSTDREYTAAEQPLVTDLFGDSYNRKFLDYLSAVADAREDMTVTPSAPLFDWIKEDISPGEPHQDTSNFNAHIKAPQSSKKGKMEKPIDKNMLSSHGEFNDNAVPNVKFAQKASTGKKQAMVQPLRKV